MDFSGQVAIVTGAGRGLGRAHALAFARAGAKVVVNDLAGSDGDPAAAVAAEILAAGGEAVANGASVTDRAAVDAMVAETLERWGRIDILVNNAGILRDRSFGKLTEADMRDVIDVHLMGAFHCTQAVWETMRAQAYGRIVMTTSASGLFGNFGQANYGAAKLALVGLMQTLSIEGARYGIRVNAIAPSAATRMTQDILTEDVLAAMTPERVSPAVLFLASRDAPTRCIMTAGAGGFEIAEIGMTQGIMVTGDPTGFADIIARRFDEIADRTDAIVPANAMEPPMHQMAKFAQTA
ncbi:SDR family NAD(P)-dependent oxidoreductase [Flavisphingomonas formosensis]|uniref:SDR family NAD(P)-dependent oxidoreductase n=1 Tax=Flavisphingomonas formosensis TaxID=861534 RepID=UPI0012FC6517|nr:SDR family NAD(P)-dependent oxidoreductase [Sphingomonas formosensis]